MAGSLGIIFRRPAVVNSFLVNCWSSFAKGTMTVRVRFAPSPTGSLHVGGARTALFNWLFARHHGGKFILRIEDTDQARSTRASEATLLEDLRWLGLDWDEGPDVAGAPHAPYRQSERRGRYDEAADRLQSSGKLFPCFCDESILERKRKEAEEKGLPVKYDGACRDLAAAEAERRSAAGEKPVWRFRSDEKETVAIEDIVRGRVEWSGESLGDFVVLRSDGMPVYNFAVVVDDADMRITHVIRAEEHLTNTHRQVLLYRALGATPPIFAHVSLILAPDRSKLSKRHGATSVGEFREQGYLPDALVNFLALLGWNPGDEREVLTRDELVREFSLERVNKAPAIFNLEKLGWMNAEYLRKLSPAQLAGPVEDRLRRLGISEGIDRSRLESAIGMSLVRARGLDDLSEAIRFFFEAPSEYEPEGMKKHAKGEELPARLRALAALFETIPEFAHDPLEEATRKLAETNGVGLGKIAQPARLALTGRSASPPLFDVILTLGREESVRRIRLFAERLGKTEMPAAS